MPTSTAILNSTGPEPAEAARLARDVMQGSDFWWKHMEPGATPEAPWLKRILGAILDVLFQVLDAVGNALGWLLRLLFGALVPTGGAGGSIFVWIIACAIIGWALWKLVPLFIRGEGSSPSLRPDAVPLETLAAASDIREQASQALASGRHAEAIRLALLALIASLEQQGLLRYDTTRTNREYRTELGPRPDLAERFGRLARIYERVWYGREPAALEQAEESIRLCALAIDGELANHG